MAAASGAQGNTRPAISLWVCLLFFIAAAATLSDSAVVKASHHRLSEVVVYVHTGSSNNSVAAMPLAPASSVPPIGGTLFTNNVLRMGAARDCPQIGYSLGIDASGGNNFYFSNVYVLSTGYLGSITVQGEATIVVPGEVAVTGGTGDFRFARGYLESVPVSSVDATEMVFMSTFYIKYD